MRVVVQRVSSASVAIGGEVRSSIGLGLLILLGVGHDDCVEDVDYLVNKTVALRIFDDGAAGHEKAIPLYRLFCDKLSEAMGKPVGTGEFGADMKVSLVNDGPVTICIDSKNK